MTVALEHPGAAALYLDHFEDVRGIRWLSRYDLAAQVEALGLALGGREPISVRHRVSWCRRNLAARGLDMPPVRLPCGCFAHAPGWGLCAGLRRGLPASPADVAGVRESKAAPAAGIEVDAAGGRTA